MGLLRRDEYCARADECKQRAAVTHDTATQSQWLRLANSWQALADSTARTYEVDLQS